MTEQKDNWQDKLLTRRIRLGNFPTPLQPLPRLAAELGCQSLWIKRDDLTDVALSGNKIRKLEFLAYEALQQGATALLTFGGPQTNHGRLTAAVARRLGLRPILILDGEAPEFFSGNLVLDLFMQADLHFCGARDPEAVAAEVTAQYTARGERVYAIPVGGSNWLGTLGYVLMMQELSEQTAAQQLKADHIFVGAGSMGTFAGMMLGERLFPCGAQIHGVPVSPPPRTGMAEKGADLCRQAAEHWGLPADPPAAEDFILEWGPSEAPYGGLAYNVPDEHTMDAVELLARSEAIFLDPTYTGKVARACVDLIRQGRIKPSETVILVHSGGSPALWADHHLAFLQERLRRNYEAHGRNEGLFPHI